MMNQLAVASNILRLVGIVESSESWEVSIAHKGRQFFVTLSLEGREVTAQGASLGEAVHKAIDALTFKHNQ